jgi:arginine N-succinyltransferase
MSAPEFLTPRLGLQSPRFHLRLGRVVHAAEELELFRLQTTLLLSNDLTGEAELRLDAPRQTRERVRAALEAIRGDREAYGERLVVELPGWRDAQGRSPFWDGFGAKFYPGDPAAAETRLGLTWRCQLAALLPRQVVYLSFLSAQAQDCAGRVHTAWEPALAELQELGFEPSGQLRIDDAGPVLQLRLATQL